MPRVPLFQVDAFADRPFAGNPAAVCLLDDPADAEWMQNVAAEMNLAETAFVRPLGDRYELRWFTPAIEVDLCGHATLAAAHVLWSEGTVAVTEPIRFQTRSGVLTCSNTDGELTLDFPATPATEETEPTDDLIRALGVEPICLGRSRFDRLVVVDSERTVRELTPDFSALGRVETRGVMVTSRADGEPFDFVSRFFAPAAGIDEDPVTGSAHCCLGPYWGEQLGKTELLAFQASPRGGTVRISLRGDRVRLSGRAVTVLRGEWVG